MFTGIIEELGRLQAMNPKGDGMGFEIMAEKTAAGLKSGDSIACNGVCLTATAIAKNGFTVHAVRETLRKSTLGAMQVGEPINLEAAVRAATPMGGHFVMGHVDGMAEVMGIVELEDGSREISVKLPSGFDKYCVVKGSVTLNGVSLTIAEVLENTIRIALIPHTLAHTNLFRTKAGFKLNFEVDIMGKYVEKLLSGYAKPQPGPERLEEWGYGV